MVLTSQWSVPEAAAAFRAHVAARPFLGMVKAGRIDRPVMFPVMLALTYRGVSGRRDGCPAARCGNPNARSDAFRCREVSWGWHEFKSPLGHIMMSA
jgi:hypothetical protein